MDDGLRKDDPYRNMDRSDTEPDFLPDKKAEKEQERDAAAEDLRNNEDASVDKGGDEDKAGLPGVREKEESGGFTSSVTGKKSERDKKKGKGGIKGILKKKGPMGLIIGLIFGGGGLMMGAQSLMPIAIQELIIEKFNSIGISSTMASDAWLDVQLNQGVRLENLKSDDTQNLFAFSPYQVGEFEKQGIKVVSNVGVDTTAITTLLYKKGDQYIPVVGSDMLKHSKNDLVNAIQTASGIGEIGTPISAKEALADPDFKTPYTTASRTWRGGSSGWFDGIMSNITEAKLSTKRNRWARYVAKGISGVAESMSEEFQKAAKSAIKDKTSDFVSTESFYADSVSGPGGGEIDVDNLKVGDTYYDKNGVAMTVDEIKVESDGKTKITGSNKNSSIDGSANENLQNKLNSKAVKAAAAAADVANGACALIEGLMSIYTTVSAYQSLQFLNLISGYLEAVSKVKAGNGGESPVHAYNNNLTTQSETVAIEVNGTATETSMGGTTSEVVAKKSAMESAGMANLFTNSKISSNDTSVQNVNLESIMQNISSITGNVRLTAGAFETCGYVKIGTSTVSLIVTAISFIPIFGQGIKLAQIGVTELVKVAVSAAASLFFHAAIPIIAKKVANVIIKDAATEWFGEDLGNALVSGASKYLGGNATSGGQSPGSKAKVLGYLVEKNAVIAEEAKYQRSVRSPFDASSPYTFLGSLAYSIMPFAYSNNSLISSIRDMSSIATSAMVGMMPTVSAVDIENELTSTGDCPLLETTGVVGDAFCNPYIITDTSTIGLSAIDVRNAVLHMNNSGNEIASINLRAGISSDNFESDGYTIKKGSDLAKYITYCGQRTSQYGLYDAAIAERSTEATDVGKIIGFVPVLSDIQNIANTIKEADKQKWVRGDACVNSEENDDWNTIKYYARYAENERLLENMNPGYKSTITAYVESYYKENPLDDSFEGTLARFSGQTKDQVENTLALIEYYQFIAEYNPLERYAFGEPEVEKELKFDNEHTLAVDVMMPLGEIVYADVRNRNFVV